MVVSLYLCYIPMAEGCRCSTWTTLCLYMCVCVCVVFGTFLLLADLADLDSCRVLDASLVVDDTSVWNV